MDIFKNGIIRFYVMQTSKTCCARVLSEWREFFGDAVFPNQRKEEFRQENGGGSAVIGEKKRLAAVLTLTDRASAVCTLPGKFKSDKKETACERYRISRRLRHAVISADNGYIKATFAGL